MACGGASKASSQATETATTAAATASARAPALSALALLPDLKAKGFTRETAGKLPAPSADLDLAYAVYQATNSPVSARVQVAVYPTEQIASGDFTAQAEGWRKPPPALFGTDLGNVDASPIPGFQQSAGYVSGNADSGGNHVWTDVYRVGRVIIVTHALGKDEATTAPVRNAIAVSIKEQVK